jgi:hypothetical protein
VREEGLFDNLGKTKSEFKINDREHTADVTLTFAGENPDQKPGKKGRGRGADDRFLSSVGMGLRPATLHEKARLVGQAILPADSFSTGPAA